MQSIVAGSLMRAFATWRHLGMSATDVDSVATFYNLIFRKPVGRHVIIRRRDRCRVCHRGGYCLHFSARRIHAGSGADGHADTVIILENDLYRRAPAAEVDSFLKAATHLIVLDHLANSTTEKAELVLPAGTFAESDGTFVSSEGRAQRFFQVFDPQNDVSGKLAMVEAGSLARPG